MLLISPISLIVSAAGEANLHSMRCFAHCLNLAVQKGVEKVAAVLTRVKKIVTYFRKSPTAFSVLRSKQSTLKLPLHKLIVDVLTRYVLLDFSLKHTL